MKIIGYVLLASLTLVALLGAGSLYIDPKGNAVNGLVPVKFNRYSSTKKSITVNTKGLMAVRIKPTKDINVYLNGTGAPWPIAAGEEDIIPIAKYNAARPHPIMGAYSTSKLVFTVISSASSGKTQIGTQEQ